MFFLWFICEKSVHFSMLFICCYHIRNHINYKKANNSARTPTSSKTIVKMSNQKLRSVGSETVNDVSIKNDVISCCYFFADGLNCSRCDEREDECNLLRTEKDLIKAKKEKLEELSREKSQVEKHQEDFLKVKKNLSREKKKVKEVKEELLVENKAKKKTN